VGDVKVTAIWMGVGMALSRWESLEENMAGLFETLAQSDSLAVRRAYGSLVGGRKDMLLSAAEAYVSETNLDKSRAGEISKLLDHYGHASGRRNELAHGSTREILERGYFLFPAFYSTRKNNMYWNLDAKTVQEMAFSFPKYRYTSENILLFVEKIMDLAQACSHLRIALLEHNHVILKKMATQKSSG
jgi:hypothetical protein